MNRQKIAFITNSIIQDVISKGKEKLNLDGIRLVLESHGTKVEDDEILKYYSTNVFLILGDGQA